jgi:hypothetical protein
MPRPKKSANASTVKADNIAPYFRQVFTEQPKLLKIRSNDQVLKMWEADHPEYNGIPDNVKTGLANVKSVMRSKRRKRGRPSKADAALAIAAAPKLSVVETANAAEKGLEKLEIMIDDCIAAAKELQVKGLDDIIKALRYARRHVVWKLG